MPADEKKEKKLIKKLYIMQIRERGIDKEKKLSKDAYKYLNLVRGRYWLKEEARKKITIVATGGVFDVIHYGHILTLRQAKKYGDVLVVVAAHDDIALKKGRTFLHEQEKRVELLNNLKLVDIAIPGGENIMDTVRLINPDVIVFGYDQMEFYVPNVKTVKLNISYKPEVIKTSNILRGLGHV